MWKGRFYKVSSSVLAVASVAVAPLADFTLLQARESPHAGLTIYAARGLRSGTAEMIAVAFNACGGWQFFPKNEMRKLDIFQEASNVSLVAEAGAWKKSASMRKLKLRELKRRILC